MKGRKMSRAYSRKVFKKTGRRTRAVNLMTGRGGIRL